MDGEAVYVDRATTRLCLSIITMEAQKKKRKADARVTKRKMNSSSAVIWPGPNLQWHNVGGAEGVK